MAPILDVAKGRFYRTGDIFTTGKSGITGTIAEIIAVRPNLTKLRLDTGAGMRYAMVPNWDNGVKGMDVYTIPQPVPVDIKFSVKIICNRMRELNKFNQIVIEKFASRQAYTQIKSSERQSPET